MKQVLLSRQLQPGPVPAHRATLEKLVTCQGARGVCAAPVAVRGQSGAAGAATFSPPRMMIFQVRPVMWTKPTSPRWPTSQPPLVSICIPPS